MINEDQHDDLLEQIQKEVRWIELYLKKDPHKYRGEARFKFNQIIKRATKCLELSELLPEDPEEMD